MTDGDETDIEGSGAVGNEDYPSVACGDSSPDKGSQGVPQLRTCDGAQVLEKMDPTRGTPVGNAVTIYSIAFREEPYLR